MKKSCFIAGALALAINGYLDFCVFGPAHIDHAVALVIYFLIAIAIGTVVFFVTGLVKAGADDDWGRR